MLSVNLGIEKVGFNKTLEKKKRIYIVNAHHDETHSINSVLHELPPGRYKPTNIDVL